MEDNNQEHLESSQEETQEESSGDPSDKMTPDHPRFKQVLERAKRAEGDVAKLQEQLAELQEKIEARTSKSDSDDLNYEEEQALERIYSALKAKKGIMTAEEFRRNQEAEKRETMLNKLEGEYTGKNGYPKFDRDDVIAHAKANGFGSNYAAAYRDLHFDALVEVESKRRLSPPPESEKPGVQERKIAEGLTLEKINSMSPSEYAQNRDKINAWMKQEIRSGKMINR